MTCFTVLYLYREPQQRDHAFLPPQHSHILGLPTAFWTWDMYEIAPVMPGTITNHPTTFSFHLPIERLGAVKSFLTHLQLCYIPRDMQSFYLLPSCSLSWVGLCI